MEVVYNQYGPTETTILFTRGGGVGSGEYRASGAGYGRVCVGFTWLRPVPHRVVGGVVFGWGCKDRAGLYPGQPDLTGGQFVADPFEESGARLYRTR